MCVKTLDYTHYKEISICNVHIWDFLIGSLATSSDVMMGFHLEPIKYYYDEAPTLFRSCHQ